MHMDTSSELMGKDHLGTWLATGLAALVCLEPLPSELKKSLNQAMYLPESSPWDRQRPRRHLPPLQACRDFRPSRPASVFPSDPLK
jgi:hypothetical protein